MINYAWQKDRQQNHYLQIAQQSLSEDCLILHTKKKKNHRNERSSFQVLSNDLTFLSESQLHHNHTLKIFQVQISHSGFRIRGSSQKIVRLEKRGRLLAVNSTERGTGRRQYYQDFGKVHT